MKKIPWKFIWAFYIPLHFAIGSFYAARFVMNGRGDCRNPDSLKVDCANANTLSWYDLLTFSGFFFIVIALALPLIIFHLTKKDSEGYKKLV